MNRKIFSVVLLAVFFLFMVSSRGVAHSSAATILAEEPSAATAVLGTSFTYQGQLIQNDNPVSGMCDFQFALWDAVSGGSQIGSTQTTSNVNVSDGLFTIQLDFGIGVFDGEARWLGISVRCPAGSGAYTGLSPRQALTASPYALALPGLWTQPNPTSPNLIGGFSGNTMGGGVMGGTIGGGGQSGAINQVLDAFGVVSGGRGNIAGGLLSAINGGEQNTALADYAAIGGGQNNVVTDTFGTVGGGSENSALGIYTTVSGGQYNSALNWNATVGGGYINVANGLMATVGGGSSNSAIGDYATVAGGVANDAHTFATTVAGGNDNNATASAAAIGGGQYNNAGNYYATISGGGNNTATGLYSAIGGGSTITVTSDYGTAGGGNSNLVAGIYGTVGGGWNNSVTIDDGTVSGGVYNSANGTGATVAGGASNTNNGYYGTVGGGSQNYVDGYAATISGGEQNTAPGNYSTVSGGNLNHTYGDYSAIAAGNGNVVYNYMGTIGGGSANYVSGDYATIAGGVWNRVEAPYGTIGGGGNSNNTYRNYVTDEGGTVSGGGNNYAGNGSQNTSDAYYATIGGGWSNTAGNQYATVGGGNGNTASGLAANVPGGSANTAAGNYSFAAGCNAQANHDGSFVWADSLNCTPFASQRADQFRVRAYGGAQFNDDIGNWVDFIWSQPIDTSTGAYLSWGGTWTNASDANLKENYAAVDPRQTLETLADLSIQSWNYKSEGSSIRHIGPTAQDFYAAFHLGDSDKAISTVDADGVALTAIQGLYEITQEQAAQIEALQTQYSSLEARVTALENASGKSSGINWQAWLPFAGLLGVFFVIEKRRRSA